MLTTEQIEELSQAAAQLLEPQRLEGLREASANNAELSQQIADQMAFISSQILDVKNKIGESAYPTGLKYFCSPRFWVPFIGVGISGMSMMAFNGSVKAVTEQGDVIFTDWIPFKVKEALIYVSGTMATNLPLNMDQAVKVSFAEAKRFMPESLFGLKTSHFLGDLKLRGNFDRMEAQKSMAAVTIDQSVTKKRYVPTITWSLGSAFAFAGLGLMGGMSWAWVPSVILAFGFLHMAAMTYIFLKEPKLNLNAEEHVAKALRDVKVGRLEKVLEKLVPWLYDVRNNIEFTTLKAAIEVLQNSASSEEDKAKAQTQFELLALNSLLGTQDKTSALTYTSKGRKILEWFKRPASYSVFLIVALVGYVSSTMDFIHWSLDKIHEASDSEEELAYNITGKILGGAFFFPFLAFVFMKLPGGASAIWNLLRHPQDSFNERSLALRQWPGMFLVVAFFWMLVIPSTASINYLNNAFLVEAFSSSLSSDSELPSAFVALYILLQIVTYPLTFMFNSLGINPATSMLADNATAMKPGDVSPKQMQQKIKENLERLAEFEAKKTPAAFLLELKDVKDQMGQEAFNDYCEVLFNLEDFKAFVASVFPGYETSEEDHQYDERAALLAETGDSENAKIQEILTTQDFASLIDVCFRKFEQSVREQVSQASFAEAAETHGLFGGKSYRGFKPEEHKQKRSCCLIM